jgi:hypothetical protein
VPFEKKGQSHLQSILYATILKPLKKLKNQLSLLDVPPRLIRVQNIYKHH